ncbi:MAG TPA: carboxypeptidase-like regulatory domain-containing protein [Candidatus Sulfotelmatobacter sp.]|nr:carboxypeptidase-like regulatory domain-containing protein [Candidatus Sulfotelmatobacter sp.]
MLKISRISTIGWMTLALLCLFELGVTSTAQDGMEVQKFNGPYNVSGVVVSKVDGHPLPQTRVALAETNDRQKVQYVITGDDGRFVFPSVPAGKFSLTGRKRGFIPAAYDQHDQFSTAIVTRGGLDTENLVLKLSPDGLIYGKILDEAGEPVRHATVTLYYDDHSAGIDQIRLARNATTDDLGAYEMSSLQPGTYYVSATAQPWYAVHPPSQAEGSSDVRPAASAARSLDVAYPVTYYPDVTDAESATPIPLRGGERLEVDIHFNPVQALRLLFHVSGDRKRGYVFPQLFQQSLDGSSSTNFMTGTNGVMISPGLVEISGIPAGRYDIRLQDANTSLQVRGVDVATQGQEVDTSTAEALSHVKLTVQVRGGESPSEIVAVLRSQGKRGMQGARLNANGEAEFQQVSAGDYELVVFGIRKNFSIAQISVDGAKVSGRNIEVAPGSSVSVNATITPGSVAVDGVAKRAGKPFAGAMVVLVPRDVEGNRDLFRRDQSDQDGTFSLRDVVPGDYTLVAIENGWDLDWSKPEVIAVYAKHGRAVQVGETPGKPLQLESPIEVVPK